LNLTAPSWAQLIASTDVNGATLNNMQNISATSGTAVTFNLTNLTAGTTYNIYFGAENSMIPPGQSYIYVISTTTTNSSGGGGGSGSSSSGKLMGGLALIWMAFLAFILG
jgi:hypothetical protein